MPAALKRKEWMLILLGWILVYASTPLYMYYAEVSTHEAFFEWDEILNLWGYLTVFLTLFLLHHFLLIPKLILRKRITAYVVTVLVLLSAFVVYMRVQAPHRPAHQHILPEQSQADAARADRQPQVRPEHFRPFLLAPPDMARLVIALLMLGADLGVVAWTNGQKVRQQLLLLERQNLKQELQHLRYQINPHFFMNTLNNIHVLIDLDQERAKRAIVELSGMMRYALYETEGGMVPLMHEITFLRQYVSLMQLRYSSRVEVQCDLPQHLPSDIQILPLLLPTFVENAFKHGVSYQEHSFIHLSLEVASEPRQIRFRCVNSCHPQASQTPDGHHGIGLENVRKRLDLQYADRYQLHISQQPPTQFVLDLTLPA